MSKHFSLIVIGDNPDELIKKYDANLKVEPYIKYRYKDAKKLHDTAIKMTQDLLEAKKCFGNNQFLIDSLEARLSSLKSMSDFEYYSQITNGYDYDENGDVETDENPDGKWETCSEDVMLLYPFILKDDTKTFAARMWKIDWEKMHFNNKERYIRCWNLLKGICEPETDEDKTMLSNMANHKNTVLMFNSAEEYAIFNTAYWECAVIDKDGWHDYTGTTRYEWISQFYNKYIKDLDKDELLTIYDYTVKES